MTALSGKTGLRVAKNTIAQVVALASTVVSKLLILIVIGRLYGAEQVGDYATVMTFSLLFTFIASAGLHWSLVREIATHPDKIQQYANHGTFLVMLTGLLTIPLMVGAASLLGYGHDLLLAVGLAAIALLIDCMAQVIGGLFNGLERMELSAIIIIVQEVAFLILVGVVLFVGLPFLWLFVVYVPSRFLGLLTALVLYKRVTGHGLRFQFNLAFAKSLLRDAAPYAANMALGPIYLRIDLLMLSYFHGSLAVGLYEAAASIFYRFNILARMFNNALMPLMAREYEVEEERIRQYMHAAIKYQVILGVPLTLLCLFLGRQFITAVYGAEFAGAGLVFVLLSTIITMRFLNNTFATTLTAVDMQTSRSLIVASVAVINIALNLYMIPRYSYLGAAISTIITEICFCAGLYIVLARRIKHPLAKTYLPQVNKPNMQKLY